MTKLVFAPAAREDLNQIVSTIATDSPARAASFLAELEAKARQAAERPLSFASRDDVSPGLRMAVHGRYLILFRTLDVEVRIVRVIHGARDLARIFET